MKFDENTPRSPRSIGKKDGPSFTVQIPQPFTAGPHTLTEGEASALNQTVAENLSNNLREKVAEGRPAIEADKANGVKAEKARPYTDEEVQALVDAYLADYEIGVRRAGSGEPRITDPVEREARKIAKQKAVELVKANGGKPSDYDMGPITDSIFEANKDLLMSEGKKIVDALEAARKQGDGLTVAGISLPPKAPPAQTEAEDENDSLKDEEDEAA